MYPVNKLWRVTAFVMITLATTPAAAGVWSQYDAVRSNSGNVVLDNRGNCVRTQWMVSSDPCSAPQTAVVIPTPMPPEPPQTLIQSEARTVYFDFNSARLRREDRAKLDYLSKILRNAKDVEHARIVGYADRLGTASYNLALSKRRAEAVQNYLAKRGYLNTSIAEVRGVGKKHSSTPCPASASREEAIACLSPDRKVEVEIVYDVEADAVRH